MKTNSQKSFIKVKLWFSKLLNIAAFEQEQQIQQLHENGTLDTAQIKLLKNMLQADKATAMATNVQSSSAEVVSEAGGENPSFQEKQIGPYKIIKPLGEGGMGQVYLGKRNDGVFEQEVALKLPHSSFNKKMLERFENERQILAQLTHNNIAHLLDGGMTKDNQPYLVMEYIQGKDIDDYCIEKIPTLHERIELILQICSAVTFSHQQLVLHRDLKPSNILVTDDGQVKLLDFGIAKLLDLNEEAKAKNTATQIMTRYYASPEQLQGKAASTHSDLFSLAIITYELITGYHPFKHKTQQEREQNLISGKIMRVTQRSNEQEPLFPELTQIANGKIEGDLENILLKALSVEPENRYESVKEFANDLRDFCNNKPVTAMKPSYWYYLTKLIQRNKLVTFAIVMTSASLVGSTVFSIQKAHYAESQRVIADEQKKLAVKQQKLAVKQKDLAEIESEKSKQIAEFLQDMFKKARPLPGKSEVTAENLLDEALQQLKDDKNIDKSIKYPLMAVLFTSYIELQKIDLLEDIIVKAHDACVVDFSPGDANCQNLSIIQGELLNTQRKDVEAIKVYEQVENLARSRKPIDKITLTEAMTAQFNSLMNISQGKKASKKLQEALKILETLKNKDYKIYQTRIDISYAYLVQKRYQEASVHMHKVDEYISKHQLKNSIEQVRNYQLKSFEYEIRHDAIKALKYKKMAVDKIDVLYPDKKPSNYIFNLKALATTYYNAGLIEQALDSYDKLINYYKKNTNGLDRRLIQAYARKLIILLAKDDIKQAAKTNQIISAKGKIDKHIDNRQSLCMALYVNTFLIIRNRTTSNDEKELAIKKYSSCAPDTDYNYYNTFYSILNAEYAILRKDKQQALKYSKQATKLWEIYPKDYLGLKKQVHFLQTRARDL